MTNHFIAPQEVPKPWGKELIYCVTDSYAFKMLCITKGHRLSLQYHVQKDESWFIKSGRVLITYQNETFEAGPGQFIHVPKGTIHRLAALEDTAILEVSTPHLDDIVRLHDDYKRNLP